MTHPRKARIRFRERAELLDFLLEVSRITSETLDLDKLLENVASIVKEVVPYDLFAILLYRRSDRRDCRIRYAIGHREEVVRSLVIPLNEGVTGRPRPRRAAGAGGRCAAGPALPERAGRGAQRTGRAHDGARQTGGRDRCAVDPRESVQRAGSQPDASDCRARGVRRSTMRACTAAWTGRTARCGRWRICRRNSARFWIWMNCSTRSRPPHAL